MEKFVTVTALTKYIKRKFEKDDHLKGIYIKGEISNFKQHGSGHMYFTLKDENAKISAVMFAYNNNSLPFRPENGMKVMLRGDISVFEASGNYQVYVREMHPDGVGDLFIAFQQLKERLEKEGLFSPKYKQPLPEYPNTIGVITSPTGAAVRDMIITLRRRYPTGRVILYPALVQGPQAPKSIVDAIGQANERDEADVLIVGRGGGSIEELWAFNDEEVARAIYSSRLPVISAVGHETDTTIADFVADVRAATPTAAAELAVPNIIEVSNKVKALISRMTTLISHQISRKEADLKRQENSYVFRFPDRLYQQKAVKLDRLTEALQNERERYFRKRTDRLLKLQHTLSRHQPEQRIAYKQEKVEVLSKQLQRRMKSIIASKQQAFEARLSKMNVLNPLNIMERGYSITFDSEQQLVKSKDQVSPGDEVKVVLKDGQLVCEVKELKESAIDE
ncbi:MAG: exodeoxyribonuclease VII large subunit [Bacillus sp. (in: firmicutes)]